MRLPDSLVALIDQGIIERVVRPLKSGKEAQVYLVEAGDRVRVAKVYKDSDQRSFKNRAQYTEGRRVRNSRDQRAIEKRTRHGRSQDEAAWKSAEVDVIYRLHAAGVRVPEPYHFIDGVLIMELVEDARGEPAPRLAEVPLDAERARTVFDQLLREVVKMLAAGIVHGDLSDYNVLLDEQGPVVIDFPQSVDASVNRNARNLLLRDVDNLTRSLSRFANVPRRPYGQELWAAYEDNTLSPDMELTGRWKRSDKATDMGALLYEIEAAEEDERRRRAALGQAMPTPRKREVVMTPNAPADGPKRRRRGRGKPGGGAGQERGATGQGRGQGGERRRDGGGPHQGRGGQQQGRDGQQQGRGGQQQSRDGRGQQQHRDGQQSRGGQQSRDGQQQSRDGRGQQQSRDGRGQQQSRDGQQQRRDGQQQSRDGQQQSRDGQQQSRDGQQQSRDGQQQSRDGQQQSRSKGPPRDRHETERRPGRDHAGQRGPGEGAPRGDAPGDDGPPKRKRRRRRRRKPKGERQGEAGRTEAARSDGGRGTPRYERES